jgi:hypothetical protein
MSPYRRASPWKTGTPPDRLADVIVAQGRMRPEDSSKAVWAEYFAGAIAGSPDGACGNDDSLIGLGLIREIGHGSKGTRPYLVNGFRGEKESGLIAWIAHRRILY